MTQEIVKKDLMLPKGILFALIAAIIFLAIGYFAGLSTGHGQGKSAVYEEMFDDSITCKIQTAMPPEPEIKNGQ